MADGLSIDRFRAFASRPDKGDLLLRVLEGRPGTTHALSLLWIVALLWASFLLTWAAGGTNNLAPHWFYVPVLLAAGRFGPVGAALTGLAAGLLAGPFTPAEVSTNLSQPVGDWTIRAVFFIAVGLFFTQVLRRTRTSVDQELVDLRLSAELAGAAARGELVLEFQPIVALHGRELIAAEALVRWDHPERGRLGPDQFIPQSEASGQILQLGAWVLDEACRHLAGWLAGPIGPDRRFRLSVNVSVRQMEDGDLVAVVERALRRHQVDPGRLVIEVTESAGIAQSQTAWRQLERLRRLGVLVAVDDFGTGYSSLSQLGRLPVDIVKIDRELVVGLDRGGREDDRRVAAGIIDLAHDLGMAVVAEGIETEHQAETLRELGCRRGQGWLFDRALPAADLVARLEGDSPSRRRPTHPRLDRDAAPHRANRLRWTLDGPDALGQQQARTTALAALFIAGACMAITANALDLTRQRESFIAALVGACGLPVAAALLRWGPRLPRWTLHLFLASGTAVVSVGAVLSNDPGVTMATASLYGWVVIYAAAFYDWPIAAAHFASTAAGLTIVVTVADIHRPSGAMVMVLGSAAVGAGVVGWMARQLRTFASTDLLTGLPNRQAFEAMLPREIARAARDGSPLCIAVVDIDDFKDINDSQGHQAGDGVLASLPGQWVPNLRATDVVARVGGDEFVVLLPDCALPDAAAALERMRADSEPGCSVGVAMLGEGESPDGLMARADRALYEAKRAGAGRVVAAGPGGTTTVAPTTPTPPVADQEPTPTGR